MKLTWLKDAVIYQIYPQSFQDTNGDGIGDFQGIIKRLDYIKSIGINVIWLNPCFDSPFGDAGYDVRDFYKVAPRYGTEDDLKELFDEAHNRGIKVVLDLVAGHTSMDNPWFVEEAADPKNPNSNRYIWKNRDFDTSKGPDKEDFVSNFFWYQPALNYGWDNPTEPWQDSVDAPGPKRNRQELRNILAYWFDRGCDGFRVDMAASLVKGEHEGNSETVKLWLDVREWMEEKYPECALMAEWSQPKESIPAGFHVDFMMHFNAPGYPSLFFNGTGTLPYNDGPCYFDPNGKGDYSVFREEYARQLEATRGLGYISMPTANHDFQRLRCGERDWNGIRSAWVFLMTQAGIPTIYYGDEIGMRFVEGTPAKEGSTLQGITAPNAGAPDGERSGTRTPMQWDNSTNDGFSTASGDELYLPIDPCDDRPNVEEQEKDPSSILNFVRTLTELRVKHPALGADGEFEILNPEDKQYPMVYARTLEGVRYMIALNPSDTQQGVSLEGDYKLDEVVLDGAAEVLEQDGGVDINVPGYGYGIYKLLS